jgi:post-segregation antitoxin (ccd killing protein)
MKLLNVRLDEDDARRAGELRKAGVQISRLVRDAIRAEHDERIGKRRKRKGARDIIARIYAEHPDPPGLPRRRFDLRDRRAVRRAIGPRLGRRRS